MEVKARDYTKFERFTDVANVDSFKSEILAGDRGMAIWLINRLYRRFAELIGGDENKRQEAQWIEHVSEAVLSGLVRHS
jgi:hypothetical protein